ncbi:hypothetical protein FDI23_gp020 [Serratia phage CHI14]|uniref:Molybdenum ABC transporter n=2 Tax=Winklervirus chi14 TaxID=2560752 RepID=A0A1Z1LY31_9CAUD|nr:hypothetical protein FDI23_gp020 [Serratia phage CHI14]ARW57443.1 hypothetical protein [Serratia phage CHI14]ARW57718.1 hypothetical protein [Serratia phage CBH8]
MDLFDMLVIPDPKPEANCSENDIASEITVLAQKHDIEIPESFANELAAIFKDPPPWAPWA